MGLPMQADVIRHRRQRERAKGPVGYVNILHRGVAKCGLEEPEGSSAHSLQSWCCQDTNQLNAGAANTEHGASGPSSQATLYLRMMLSSE